MRPFAHVTVATAFAAMLAAALCACEKTELIPGPGSEPQATAPPGAAAGARPGAADCSEAIAMGEPRILGNERLSADELRDFYHLSEGSEIFPLAWLRALRDPKTKEKIFDHLDRYGFLPDSDPSNGEHLPIGMTTTETRDSSLLGIEMFGFNCAACHVGQVQAEGKAFRILGAPNLADVHQFLTDFGAALGALIGSSDLLLQFMRDLHAGSESQALALNPSAAEHALLASLPPLDALRRGSPASKELASRIQRLFDAEKTDPPIPLGQGLVLEPESRSAPAGGAGAAERLRSIATFRVSPAADHPEAAKSKTRTGASARFSAETAAPAFPSFLGVALAKALEPPGGGPTGLEQDIAAMAGFSPAEQRVGVSELLAEFVDTLRFVEQRFEPLFALSRVPQTNPGAGRVDAFMTAHNVLFRGDPPMPMTAPVDYPRLWNLGQMRWLHWDGNTTSVLERNVGQALGVGAVFDPATHASTLRITNIHRLEEIAKKIGPPAWPFAAPSPNDVAVGERIYRERCATCHDSEAGGTVAAADIGTDPNRAASFARARAMNLPFQQALEAELQAVIAKAFAYEKISPADQKAWESADSAKWRTSDAYVGRGLVGVWATAPYLHNGSVPTLEDLLSENRPPAFWIGDRRLDLARGGYCAASGKFLFDARTHEAGNSNAGHTGHQYGTDLRPADRHALIAYLETLR